MWLRLVYLLLTIWRAGAEKVPTTERVDNLFPSPELVTISRAYQTRTDPVYTQPPVPDSWADLKTYRPRTRTYSVSWGRPTLYPRTTTPTRRPGVRIPKNPFGRPTSGALKDAHKWYKIEEMLNQLNTTMKFMHSLEEHTLPPGISMQDIYQGTYNITNPLSFGDAGVLYQRQFDSLPTYIQQQQQASDRNSTSEPELDFGNDTTNIYGKWPFKTRGPWNPWRQAAGITTPYVITSNIPPSSTTISYYNTTMTTNTSTTTEQIPDWVPPFQPWLTDKAEGLPIGFPYYPH